MSFTRQEWVGFFLYAVFCFADLFGERIALKFGRHRKWYRDAFGERRFFQYWPYVVMDLIYWVALVFEFIAIFLYWKNANSGQDSYTATLAFFFCASVAVRIWLLLLFGWGYAWAAILFILASVVLAFLAFGYAISDHQGVSAGLYVVYIVWVVCGFVLNVVVLATGSRHLHWRLTKKDRKLVLPVEEDPQYDWKSGKKKKHHPRLRRRGGVPPEDQRWSAEDDVEEPDIGDEYMEEQVQVITDARTYTATTTTSATSTDNSLGLTKLSY